MLSDIASINPTSQELPNVFYYIDLESVVKGNLIKETVINKATAPSRAQRVAVLNDIFFQTVRPYQQNNYLFEKERNLPTVASTGYAQIRTCEVPYFLYELLHTKKFLDQVLFRCTGSSYPAINGNDLCEIAINIPSHNEQQVIANFLRLLEKKINLQSKLIDSLKSYKRGLQQAVFREILHNIKLKDCVSFEPKSTIAAGDSCDDGKFILYRSGQKDGRTNDYTHNGVYIIANDGGEAKFKLTNGAFAYTDHCICLSAENDNLTILLANYLQMISSRITYEGFVGSGLKNIDRQYFGDIKMPIVANQQQAAKSLILIDEFIEKQNALFDYLLTIKQALLQQLFI
jgi:Restriction endonuclease S subunits